MTNVACRYMQDSDRDAVCLLLQQNDLPTDGVTSSLATFLVLEDKGQITSATEALLPALCHSLIESAWILAQGIPELTEETLNELSLLTLGPQFRGSRNINLGVEAIQIVFALIKAIVSLNKSAS